MEQSEAHEKHSQLVVKNNMNSDVMHMVGTVVSCVFAQHPT